MIRSGERLLKILRATLPWLVTAALFFYLFQKIPPAKVLEGLKRVHLPSFITFTVLYFLTILCLDTWGLSKVLSRFTVPVKFKELFPARCISYLFSLVNYNAGQAALAAYFKRTRGVSFFKTLGTILFVSIIDLYWLIAMAFAGSFFQTIVIRQVSMTQWVHRLAFISAAALVLHLAFWRGWLGRLTPERIHFRFTDWIRGRHLFQTFHHAKVTDYLRVAAYRLPVHLMIISSLYFLIPIFGASISFKYILATVPLIFLLGAIPLTPGGLGAVQVATVELLKDKIVLTSPGKPEDLLFAMSLTWMASNYILKAVIGFYFFQKSSRTLFQAKPGEAAAEGP